MVVAGEGYTLITGDFYEWLREQPDDSVDLIFGSPPYESQRAYEGKVKLLRGEDWVEWAKPIFIECVRVCRGLVAWVVEGRTSNFRYSSTPQLLHADLHRAGIRMRKPPIYRRVGICGSGGPEWLRNDYEPILCASKGRLPWANNTACGEPCKYAPGGAMSHRTAKDGRVNMPETRNGDAARVRRTYKPPAKANPGNVITCAVGGGKMGHETAHRNEAPFSLDLARFFVKSFCPPDGVVVDGFSGSATTGHACLELGRNYIGIDLRESQTELGAERLRDVARMCSMRTADQGQ